MWFKICEYWPCFFHFLTMILCFRFLIFQILNVIYLFCLHFLPGFGKDKMRVCMSKCVKMHKVLYNIRIIIDYILLNNSVSVIIFKFSFSLQWGHVHAIVSTGRLIILFASPNILLIKGASFWTGKTHFLTLVYPEVVI